MSIMFEMHRVYKQLNREYKDLTRTGRREIFFNFEKRKCTIKYRYIWMSSKMNVTTTHFYNPRVERTESPLFEILKSMLLS